MKLLHDTKWNRSPNVHVRWVHGWHVTVSERGFHANDKSIHFVITNQPFDANVSYNKTDKIIITRSMLKSREAAEKQAMAIVRALQPLALGWPA